MTIKLVIPGQREAAAGYQAAVRGVERATGETRPETDLLNNIRVVHAFSLSPTARAVAATKPETVEVQEDDVLELEIEGGFTLWTSAARYREELAERKPEALTEEGVQVDSLPQHSIQERGIKEWFTGALRVLRLEPDAISKDVFIDAGARLAAWAATKMLMARIESQLTPGPGLYQWADASSPGPTNLERAAPIEAITGIAPDQPILVFIHGTGSRTLGSFGEFAQAKARAHWGKLKDYFGAHIYAFEHPTLSQSPIENAADLAYRLPKHGRIHVVSHSRGGMVGDLLCLEEISEQQIEQFKRFGADTAKADQEDRANLERLKGLLAEKQFKIGRFARVACPARGTLLASENIDRFLSILTNLIGLIPVVGASPFYQVIKRVTLEVAKNRLDPTLIPGIEAMIPSSPLVSLLNTVERPVTSDLGVVAGDIEAGGLLKQIGLFVSDNMLYDNQDNDLVVNTRSMFEGVSRNGHGYYVFDQGVDVSHFNYFRNDRTRTVVQQWLTTAPGEPIPAQFRAIERELSAPIPMLRSIQKRSGAAQPTVFVLPGFMGSSLSTVKQRIWPEFFARRAEGLGRMKITAMRVAATSLVADCYGDLCTYLSSTHEVLPFAYDWRKSLKDSAKSLAHEVRKKLDSTTQPVRIVAHGMGGLVVRAMIGIHPDIWNEICERPGGRVLMLATPNRGTYSIVESLLGRDTLTRQLALLYRQHGVQDIVDIFARFPGALQLLPQDDPRVFKESTWHKLRDTNDRCGAVPSTDLLTEAQSLLGELSEDIPHVERVLYVAGRAPITPCGVEIDTRGRLVLKATSEGDGRTTYASGKLPGLATWYMDVRHGDLLATKSGFPAIGQLLNQGSTQLLPSAARGAPAAFDYVAPQVLYPSELDLTSAMMGKRSTVYAKQVPSEIKVSVVHSDLGHASHPVMLGHYEGDTIAGAEGYLDGVLRGALAHRYQLGIYPGRLGTAAAISGETTRFQKELGVPSGAVILGLGKMGELNTGMLAESVRKGALHYVTRLIDAKPVDDSSLADEPLGAVGLSVLLIGVNSAATMSVEDSVSGILRGVARANQELRHVIHDRARIGEIEIIELFADTAIQATHATLALADALSSELGQRIDALPTLRQGKSGKTRVVPNMYRDYWRRVIVSQSPTDGEQGALKFLVLSDRARAEASLQQRQPELIDRMVAASIGDTQFNLDGARTLFELLLPNELKDGLAQQSWLVIVVDAATASYPWELMFDGKGPLSTRVGMVRQLQTAHYRKQIRATTSRSVYVVGNPITSTDIPDLPGARAEADLVYELLNDQGYEVNYNEQPASALDVLNRLFEQPYRILHLAGHGFYEPSKGDNIKARSGMLLEGGIFLTAAEIGQMRQVPDLVFLNCCHLAQVGSARTWPQSQVPFNKLAASISRELIEMGVRAVVAAGWAVRDDAAKAFAREFYQAMLNGATFGRALFNARRKNFDDFADCNTWGAYQAYGDPDFKLNPAGGSLASRERDKFVAPEELINALASMKPFPASGRGEAVRDPVSVYLNKCPAAWLDKGEVLAAIGKAYGDLGRFEKAIEYYEKALGVDDEEGKVPIRVIEQLANFEARQGEKSGNTELVESAIQRLDVLAQLGKTVERLSVLGSAYKRKAQIAKRPDDARTALEQAAQQYREASELSLASGNLDPYPVLNWLAIEALLRRQVPDASKWFSRCEAVCSERFAVSRSFWDAVTRADSALAQQSLSGRLQESSADIVSRYETARAEARATEREFDSVLNHLAFIADMLDKLAGGDGAPAEFKRDAACLREMRRQLGGVVGGASATSEAKPTGVAQAESRPAARAATQKPTKARPKPKSAK